MSTINIDKRQVPITARNKRNYPNTANSTTIISSGGGTSTAGVVSFNTRTGDVTLMKADVETVLTGTIASHNHLGMYDNYQYWNIYDVSADSITPISSDMSVSFVGGTGISITEPVVAGGVAEITISATGGAGTVTNVTAGNGLTQTGTSTINPTLYVVSAAGTAGTVGTLSINADEVGVSLGTTSITAAAGNHMHTGVYDLYNHWHAEVMDSHGYGVLKDMTTGTSLQLAAGSGLSLSGDTATIPGAIIATYSPVFGTTANTISQGNHTHTQYLTGTKVDSFNTRTGAVTLTKSDVEAVLTGEISTHTHAGGSGSYTQWILQTENNLGTGSSYPITDGKYVRFIAGSTMDMVTTTDTNTTIITLNTANPPIRTILTSNFTTTSTTGQVVAGLATNVAVGTYLFEIVLQIGTDTTTTGINVGLNSTATGSVTGTIQATKTATTDFSTRVLNASTLYGPMISGTASLTGQVTIRGILRVTLAGAFSVKVSKQTSGTATVYTDSYLILSKI